MNTKPEASQSTTWHQLKDAITDYLADSPSRIHALAEHESSSAATAAVKEWRQLTAIWLGVHFLPLAEPEQVAQLAAAMPQTNDQPRRGVELSKLRQNPAPADGADLGYDFAAAMSRTGLEATSRPEWLKSSL
jgi:hypothetical protein